MRIVMNQSLMNWTVFFHVLSDPHRMKILHHLSDGLEKSVSELGDLLNQTQPAVSHHLSMLKDHGLIKYRRDGRFNRYSLAKEGLAKAIERVAGKSMPVTVTLAGLEIQMRRIA